MPCFVNCNIKEFGLQYKVVIKTTLFEKMEIVGFCSFAANLIQERSYGAVGRHTGERK